MDSKKIELYEKVLQWGIDRDIYKYSSKSTQSLKLMEELFEFDEAHTLSEVQDAIGDSIVVAINFFGVENRITDNKEGAKLLAITYSNIPDNIDSHFSPLLLIKTLNKMLVRDEIDGVSLVDTLEFYFKGKGYDVVECLSLAYDTIKDRKGYLTPEGNFVKEGETK